MKENYFNYNSTPEDEKIMNDLLNQAKEIINYSRKPPTKFKFLVQRKGQAQEKEMVIPDNLNEIKKELGSSLFEILRKVLIDIVSKYTQELKSEAKKINQEETESREKVTDSISGIVARIFKEVQGNSLIVRSFVTEKQQDLLITTIAYVIKKSIESTPS